MNGLSAASCLEGFTIRTSTFVAQQTSASGTLLSLGRLQLSQCLITGNQLLPVDAMADSVTVNCTDVWNNSGGDWVGALAGQQGVHHNIAADPQFCDSASGHLGLQPGSPCLGGFCEVIGGYGLGCSTWTGVASGGVEPESGPLRLGPIAPNPVFDRVLLPSAGTATWGGVNDAGQAVSSGVYFIELQTGGEKATARVIVSR